MKNPEPRRRGKEEIYFTLQAYSTQPGKLQFDLDFNVPFSTAVKFQHPDFHVNPTTITRLKNIFDHILKVYEFIDDPTGYGGPPTTDPVRLAQQRKLVALKSAGGNVSRILFNENSDPEIDVGYSGSASGNGDQKPPNSI